VGYCYENAFLNIELIPSDYISFNQQIVKNYKNLKLFLINKEYRYLSEIKKMYENVIKINEVKYLPHSF